MVLALRRYEQFGSNSDLTDLNLGVYYPVFENWNSAEKLSAALTAAANYHCSQLDTIDHGEFVLPPIDLFPAEIIAIKKNRDQAGLETPGIDHPLMQTPLANPPEHIEEPRSELLEQAISKIRNVAPYLVEDL